MGKMMTRRVYICGNFPFPRSGATSNYVQYLSAALKQGGYEVHVVSLPPASKETIHCYKGIYSHYFVYGKGKISRFLGFQTGGIQYVLRVLKKENVNANDLVICYSARLPFVRDLSKWCKTNFIKHGACVVELFDKSNFSGHNASFEYRRYMRMNKKYYPKYDFLFPISTYIEEYFAPCSIKQLRIPILADTSEYKVVKKARSDVRKFIFPANGKMKDALGNMISALESVLQGCTIHIEFHFCGIKQSDVEQYVTDRAFLQDKRIIVHSWMEYQDLVKLYNEVDFLLLARSDCQMTRANFPSKVPEVMSYGVIPIVSEVGDYTKLYLKDMENAIIMKGCEPVEIQRAIYRASQLTNKEIEQLSEEARRFVQNQLDYTKWSGTISQFLESVYES